MVSLSVMDYAIIVTGGKQFKVSPGTVLDVEKLAGEVGEKIDLGTVLAARSEKSFDIGKPNLKGAKVLCEIVAQRKDDKVINYKFKRRKGYHRKVGHRQNLTRLKVTEIVVNGT